MLLDLRTNQWSQLDPKLGAINYPRWSRDGRSIYFQDADAGVFRSAAPGIYRVPVTGGRAEKVVDMKGFRGAGSLGIGWSDLDPDDTPLLLRDVSIYDIYALALERK
jgi:Tol biopolymer transport system component